MLLLEDSFNSLPSHGKNGFFIHSLTERHVRSSSCMFTSCSAGCWGSSRVDTWLILQERRTGWQTHQHQSGGCGQEYLDSLLVFSKCLVEFTKPASPAFFFVGSFLDYWLNHLVICLLRFSISLWLSLISMYIPRNLSISCKLTNLLKYYCSWQILLSFFISVAL